MTGPRRPPVFIYDVRTDERIEGVPVSMIYAACARSAEEGLSLLQARLPDDWAVAPIHQQLPLEAVERLGLRLGEVWRLS